MNAPHPDLEACLASGGKAADVVAGFRYRDAQMAMARAVETAIAGSESLVVEAGTGTGKTWAYLLPILLSGKRAIVSTGTRTLQDQLISIDVPKAIEMTSGGGRFAVLKGRRNYLCPQRLERNLGNRSRQVAAASDTLTDRLVEIRAWQSRTRTGDLTEIIDTEAERELLPLVSSTADNCLGRGCPHFDGCPVYRARSRAADADIVIVNHHLLFSDMMLADDQGASLLPVVDVVVLDEAHQVPEIARQFFGHSLSSRQLLTLAADIDDELGVLGRDDPLLADAVGGLRIAVAAFGNALDGDGEVVTALLAEAVREAIDHLDLAFSSLIRRLDLVRDRASMLQQCCSRAIRFADLFALVTEVNDTEDEYAQWIDRHGRDGFTLHLAPIDISAEFTERMDRLEQSWIFTSATLSAGGSFAHFCDELGLERAETLRLDSPFDYAAQVAGWIPSLAPPPGSSEHTAAFVSACLPLVDSCPGRALMLFTTWRALIQAGEILGRETGLPVVMQGSGSRQALIDSFRATPRCVLIATQSFWEGVDLRGADLRLLAIDKLPFPVPDAPLTRARTDRIEHAGGNGFEEYLLPAAITALRQGFGRLIREESDRGLFVLGDSRIRRRRYGAAIIGSLPPITWLDDGRSAVRYLEQLS